MKKLCFVQFLLVLILSPLTAQNIIVPNITWIDNYQAIAFSNDGDFLITGNESGALQVWYMKDHSLVRSYPVSRLSINKIAVHPKESIVAIVETNNINLTFLSVLDWKTGHILYSKPLRNVPLEIKFSPKGNFIVFTSQDWDSLSFINADDGKQADIMAKGNGIVPAFYISDSEKTILTYNLIGSLQYWSMEDGKLKGEYATLANLQNIAFHEKAKYIAASTDRDLLIINPANGKIVKKAAVENISKLTILGNTICASVDDTMLAWHYNIPSNTLSGRNLPGSDYESNIKDFIINKKRIYTATETGIYSTEFDKTLHLPYGNLPLMDISSITAENNTLVITGESNTLLITHPLISGKFSAQIPPLMQKYKTPALKRPGICYFEEDRFFVYNTEGQNGNHAFLSVENGYSEIFSDFSEPLQSVKKIDNRLLTLSSAGNIRLYSSKEGFYPFEHTSAGIHDAVMTSSGRIISSRTKTPQYNYSLVSINLETGETLPIDNANSIINKLEIDEHTNVVYSLGFLTMDDMIYTVVKSHGRNAMGREKTLQKVYGNYPNSTFSFDRDTGRLFTSLENSTITGIRSFSTHTYARSAGIPAKIVSNRNCLISLNTNNTISFWNIKTGRYLGSLYIFQTGGWAFISDTGKLAYEGTTTRNFNAYKANSTNSIDVEKQVINWSTR